MTSRLPLDTLAERALERYQRARQRSETEPADPTELSEELASALHSTKVQMAELAKSTAQDAFERDRFRELFESCPDAYLVTDGRGIIRAANKLAVQLLGTPGKHLPGKAVAGFAPLGFRPAVRRLINRMLNGGTEISNLETPIARRGQSPTSCVLRVAANPHRVDELLWTLRDVGAHRSARDALVAEVAERRRVDDSLRRIELRYRHLVEHATDFVYELDEEGRFTFCNEFAVRRLLGYFERELLGRPLLELVPVNERDEVASHIKHLLSHPGATGYLEFPIVAKTGIITRFGQSGSGVMRANNRRGIHAICRDISPQIAKLSELQQTGETLRNFSLHLQASVEAERKRIAREIHDELGATLTALRMELAMPPADGSDVEAYRRRDRDVLKRLDRAIEAQRQILSGLRPSLLDNMGLCAALEWLAQDVFERTGIQCVANLEGLVDELEPDRSTALFRIVQEAITNALKHAQATRISIRQYTRGRRVVVDVKDNGIGVKRSHLTNRKAFGIVGMRERAAAFGGLVEIKGGPRGTRVSVLMPMAGGGDETE